MRPNGHRPQSSSRTSTSSSHKRSITVSKGNTVSVVLISSALETIANSREAKRSAPLKDSVQAALELVRSGEGGDQPRVIFEPLRLACETRNEKLMIASLDCIAKLTAYSFFVEPNSGETQGMSSPPPSPGPNGRHSSQPTIPEPSLVDIVVHTITTCHTEPTPETVSLQIVKALLAIVLSTTLLVHQSSLLKAVRTVYNIFVISNDSVNQMVAQGGLTQIVNHVFARCKIPDSIPGSTEMASNTPTQVSSDLAMSPLSPGLVTSLPSVVPVENQDVPAVSPPANEQQLAQIPQSEPSEEEIPASAETSEIHTREGTEDSSQGPYV
jgi:brefeldin A-inhibited guanine nucleotide-exchange protein